MEEVKVTIDEEGNVKLTVFGVKGPKCVDLTQKLEALLGGEIEREFTSEYYQGAQEEKQTSAVKEKA